MACIVNLDVFFEEEPLLKFLGEVARITHTLPVVFAHFSLDRVLLLMIEMFHSEDLLHVLRSCVHVLHHRFLSALLLLLFDPLDELCMVQIIHKLLVLFLLEHTLPHKNFQFSHRLLLSLLLLLQLDCD